LNKKQKKILSRILLAAALFGGIWLLDAFLLPEQPKVLRLFLYFLPYAVVGYDVLYKAFWGICHGELLDEQFLMTLATVGAFSLGEYQEAVAILLFYQIGEWFQSVAVGKSRANIQSLLRLSPDCITLLRDGVEVQLAPEAAKIGEKMAIRPGERIALDGKILLGNSRVDTAALTGESLPKEVAAGDMVYAGSMNLTGFLQVEITKEAAESTTAKMMKATEEAMAKKAKSERFITKFAHFYTPCVATAALLVAVVPPLLFSQDFGEWIHRALSFLVVSCPCALVVSIPLTFFCGMGKASTLGIYIKGAAFFERLAALRQVAFDKTGTLTLGRFHVTGIHTIGIEKDALLELAAAAESQSDHPIARSICASCPNKENLPTVTALTQLSRLGIRAEVNGKTLYVGNASLMASIGIIPEDTGDDCNVYVAEKDILLGHIQLEDEIKPTAGKAIAQLKRIGITHLLLLTGDRSAIGQKVAKNLGIDEAHCELLPEDKVNIVEHNLSQEAPLAFVGDGINDAPVLSRADIGFAMGGLGSDIATSAADVVLMDDNPEKIVSAILLSRKANRIAKQNMGLALLVKAAVLIPAMLGFVPPWLAIFADVGILILCVINAIRMLK